MRSDAQGQEKRAEKEGGGANQSGGLSEKKFSVMMDNRRASESARKLAYEAARRRVNISEAGAPDSPIIFLKGKSRGEAGAEI